MHPFQILKLTSQNLWSFCTCSFDFSSSLQMVSVFFGFLWYLASGHISLSLIHLINSSSFLPWIFAMKRLHSSVLASFQAILNTTARTVLLKHESDHFTPVVKNPQLSFHLAQSLVVHKGVYNLSSLPMDLILNSFHSPFQPPVPVIRDMLPPQGLCPCC